MLDIFDTLCEINACVSPSGSEEAVSVAIAKVAAPFADSITTDALGNLIVKKNGKPGGKKIMLSAHMDSIGLVVTYIDDKGYIRFSNLGGINAPGLPGTPVRFGNGTRGVVAMEGKVKLADCKIQNLYIDIGVSSREEAEKYVKIADVAAFDTPAFRTGNCIVSPYLDNRISCVTLLRALELVSVSTPENELYFVFSVQEEVGTRGAQVAVFGLEPDLGLAVDVTRTGDTPEIAVPMACDAGGGAAVKIMDGSLICSPKLVAALEKCAETNNIKYQREILLNGGTDAGVMQRSKGGMHAGCISIPTRYIHSPQEMCCESDVADSAALIAAFVSAKIEL